MILSQEYEALILNKINEINRFKTVNERLSKMIELRHNVYADFNDAMDEMMSRVSIKTHRQSAEVTQKVKQLSVAFGKEEEELQMYEELMQFIEHEYNDLHWYDKEMIRLYLKLGNYRSVGDETGIPWQSVYKTIKSALNKIKERCKQSISY